MRKEFSFKKLIKYFIPRGLGVWGVVTLSLTTGLSFILSTGPQVQKYINGLLNSDSETIYGSAYQESIAHFLGLHEWLLLGIQWPYLVMAAIITVFSLRQMTLRRILFSAIISSFLVLTAFDLITAAFENTISLDYTLKNVAFNLGGGIIISVLMISILVGCDFCFDHGLGRPAFRRAFGAIFAIVAGVLVSASVYYIVAFFYQTEPIQLGVLLGSPVSGFFMPQSIAAGKNKKNENSLLNSTPTFDLVPRNVEGAIVNWTSPDGLLKAEWNSLGTSVTFNATIKLYSGCMDRKAINGVNSSGIPITLNNVNSLSVSFDRGLSIFDVGSKEADSILNLDPSAPSFYWIDRDEQSKNIKLTQFVDESAKMAYWDRSDKISFYLTASLSKGIGNAIVASARMLHIQVNKRDYIISINRPSGIFQANKIVCKGINANNLLQSSHLDVPTSTFFVSALVHIDRVQTADQAYGRKDGELRVSGGSGWISVGGLTENNLAESKLGNLKALKFRGNVLNLEFDGTSIPVHPSDSYLAFGKFNGMFDETGQLRVLGTATDLWIDGLRMNSTKWEKLGWGQRLFLLTTLVTIFSIMIKIIIARLQNDSTVHWLE